MIIIHRNRKSAQSTSKRPGGGIPKRQFCFLFNIRPGGSFRIRPVVSIERESVFDVNGGKKVTSSATPGSGGVFVENDEKVSFTRLCFFVFLSLNY